VASDYQGETIQVFVFFRGKFLGYQCFGQDRLTVGGAPGMDLPLPDCPEEEGFWDVYVSRGALYAWFRSQAGGKGKEGHEDPRKVQPLDSLSLGEYRLQAKVLEGEGFLQPSTEAEEDLIEEEEEQEANSFVDLDDEDGPEQEATAETPDEVEGISLDYARSIWKGETEDQRAEAAEVEPGEEAKAESPLGIDPHYAKSFWGLSDESDTVREGDEGSESEVDEPDALDDETPGMEEIDEWIGFGLEEEREDPVTLAEEEPPEGLQEIVPLQTDRDEQTSEQSPLAADSDGLVEGMSQEERTRFWDRRPLPKCPLRTIFHLKRWRICLLRKRRSPSSRNRYRRVGRRLRASARKLEHGRCDR